MFNFRSIAKVIGPAHGPEQHCADSCPPQGQNGRLVTGGLHYMARSEFFLFIIFLSAPNILVQILIGGEKSLLACDSNDYNWYLNFNGFMSSAGLTASEITMVKMWVFCLTFCPPLTGIGYVVGRVIIPRCVASCRSAPDLKYMPLSLGIP